MDNGMGAQAGSGSADGGSVRTDSSAFDRLPPQDLEAEMATLGGMLLSKEAITDVIDVLRGPEFYRSCPRVDLRRDRRGLQPLRARRPAHRRR